MYEVRHYRVPLRALGSHLLTPWSPTSLCSTAAELLLMDMPYGQS